MRKGVAALAVIAGAAVVTAFLRPGATSSGSQTRVHAAAAAGVSDTAETVMGTLVAPPSPRFLARIRNGKMGGVILLRNGWLTRTTATRVAAQLQQAACSRGEPLLVAVDQE